MKCLLQSALFIIFKKINTIVQMRSTGSLSFRFNIVNCLTLLIQFCLKQMLKQQDWCLKFSLFSSSDINYALSSFKYHLCLFTLILGSFLGTLWHVPSTSVVTFSVFVSTLEYMPIWLWNLSRDVFSCLLNVSLYGIATWCWMTNLFKYNIPLIRFSCWLFDHFI